MFMSHVVSATVALFPPSVSSHLNKRGLCEIWLSSPCSVQVPNILKPQKPTGEPGTVAAVLLQLHHSLFFSLSCF